MRHFFYWVSLSLAAILGTAGLAAMPGAVFVSTLWGPLAAVGVISCGLAAFIGAAMAYTVADSI
jgi:hypothetical protein